MNPAVYCSTPYTLVMIQPDGSFRMCCLTNNSTYDMGGCIDDATGQVMNIFTHELVDALNSRHHKSVRLAHQAGTKHGLCGVCYNRDAINGASRRQYVSFQVPAKLEGYPTIDTVHEIVEDNKVTKGPYALDLRFGNICNLKCVTCGPWYSDKWLEEYRGFYGKDAYTFGANTVVPNENGKVFNIKSTDSDVPWWESDVWWSKLDKVLPDLKHLYITGGEPMLVPAHDKLLQRCIDAGVAHNIFIEIDTNLTALNPRITEAWGAFKQVDLRVSLDTIGAHYELFRYPSKWKTFNRNLVNLIAEGLGNVKTTLTSCITPLNVFDIDDIHEYSDANGLEGPPHFRFVEKPLHLDVRYLSPRQKDYVLNDLTTRQTSEWSKKVAQYLVNHHTTHNPVHVRRFVEFFDYLDGTRRTDWRATFPQTAALFQLP